MSPETAKVLLYSDDRTTREQVRLALGRSVAPDLPPLVIYEVATQAAVLAGRPRRGLRPVVSGPRPAPPPPPWC